MQWTYVSLGGENVANNVALSLSLFVFFLLSVLSYLLCEGRM